MNPLKKTFRHLKRHFSQYFIFEALVMLVSSSFILPQILRLYQWAMIQAGTPFEINVAALKPEVLSIRFWTTLVGIAVFAFLLMFEYIVMLVMVDANTKKHDITLLGALWVSIRNFPRMFIPIFIQFLSMGILFVPLVLTTSQFNIVNVPITVYDWFLGIKKIELYWVIIVILWLYIHVHTLYFTYIMLIEKTTIKKALSQSFTMVRKKQAMTLLRWIPVIFILFLIWLLLSVLVQTSAEWITSLEIYAWIKNIMVYVLSIFSYAMILLSFPFLITYLVQLFNDQKAIDHEPIYRPIYERFPKWIKGLHKISGFAITLLLIFSFGVNYILVESAVKWDVRIAAHRGDSGYAPENSLSSIQSAIDEQVDTVELDVMLTADGEMVLHHDQTLKRSVGIPMKVSEVSYDILKMFDIGSKKSEIFKGEYIPTLREALELSKGHIYVLLDIKDYGDAEILVPKVVALVEELDMTGVVSIQSFNSTVLRLVRELNPDIRIGQIMFFSSGDLTGLDVNFYTIKANMLTHDFVKRAHAVDREVWVWTVNSVVNLNEVMRFNIDGVITDYPKRAQSVRNVSR